MYRLRRFYLDSVGVAENRFCDLLVDLTGLDGNPADSIVWLRNGAGKTTMLSLLVALVLPNRSDFTTRQSKRTLADLVLGTDIAHVVAEWVDPAGRVMLTGSVHEWEGRVRPRDYNQNGRDRLRPAWWCVHPDPAVAGSTLDDMPFTTRSGGRVDAERFLDHIRDLAHHGVNAVVARRPADWRAALGERRFDPELFRYFAEVNATEGGIEKLFAGIDSPGAFVRWLLRFVGDRERVGQVAKLLGDTAIEIAKRPTYVAERDFCAEAVPHLRALRATHGTATSAYDARQRSVETAAGFKRALETAEAATRALAATLEERVAEIDAGLVPLRSTVRDARRRGEAYRRAAAELRLAMATTELGSVRRDAARARLVAEAWVAVPLLAELRAARIELQVRQDAMRAAATEAQPLLAAVDRARAELAGALDSTLDLAREQVGNHDADLAEVAATIESAKETRRAQQARLRKLESELTVCEHAIEEFDRQLRALVADETVGEAETLEIATEQWERDLAVARRAVDATTSELGAARAARPGLFDTVAATRSAVEQAAHAYRDLLAERTRIDRRVVELGGLPRVRELLQTVDVDVAALVTDLPALLAARIVSGEAAIVAAKGELVQDERAVRGLVAEGVLPPRVDVERVLEAMATAETSAHSGWRYLREHVPEEEHARYVAELPEVLDGVVVYGDPAAAAAAVAESVGGDLEDPVVVSAARTFRDIARDARVVLGPNPARYDVAAGAVQLTRRQDRLFTGEARIAQLYRVRSADARLLAQVEDFATGLPDDGIAGLVGREQHAEKVRQDAATAAEKARATLDEHDVRVTGLRDTLADARERVARAAGVVPQLNRLLQHQQDTVEPSRVRRGRLPGELDAVRGHLRRADEAVDDANRRINAITIARSLLVTKITTWAGEREPLPEAEPTGATLEEARNAVAAAERLLREEFREDELRREMERAEEAVVPSARRWHGLAGEVREAAEGLAGSPEGADDMLRIRATEVAEEARTQADHRVGAAKVEADTAHAALASSPATRLRDDDPPAVDRDEADRLADQAEALASDTQLEVGASERALERVKGELGRAVQRAERLGDQVIQLRAVDSAAEAVGEVSDDDNAVRDVVVGLVERLDAAQSVVDAAERDLSAAVEALRRFAEQDRFGAVADDEHGQAVKRMRELFRGEAVRNRVAPTADELADDLDVRRSAIAQQLAQVEEHKDNVVVRLADHVEDALKLLRRASMLSELPEGIGPWSGRPFLIVDVAGRPTRDQITVRVADLVERMVNAGTIERRPHELLWRATEAAVVEGFRATVLKPAPNQPIDRTPVESMQKWSGGENLTASLVVFCVLARLRSEQRTGSRGHASGGVLPLDNPLGKANYLPFLELQRRVARASGVQLVYWTGIGDLGAVTAFPRIAAMHKRPSAARPGRAYVRIDESASQTLDVTGGVRAEP